MLQNLSLYAASPSRSKSRQNWLQELGHERQLSTKLVTLLAVQIKDENMTFRADNFSQMQTAFGANARQEEQAAADERGRGAGRGRSRGRGRGRGRGQGAAKQDQGDVAADITKILKMVKMRKLEPVIIFSFARRYAEPC